MLSMFLSSWGFEHPVMEKSGAFSSAVNVNKSTLNLNETRHFKVFDNKLLPVIIWKIIVKACVC